MDANIFIQEIESIKTHIPYSQDDDEETTFFTWMGDDGSWVEVVAFNEGDATPRIGMYIRNTKSSVRADYTLITLKNFLHLLERSQ